MLSNLKIIKLTKTIQKELTYNFDCGNPALTSFLKNHIALDVSYGITYVMIADNIVVGYYNISTGHIQNEKNIRLGGTIYINCFAVDKRFQKQKMGEYYFSDIMMSDCRKRADELREKVGFSFITLSSTDEGYYLYKRNGFFELEEDMSIARNQGEDKCSPMYLPLDYE